MPKGSQGNMGNLSAFLSAENTDKSLLHSQEKFSFSKDRIIQIIETIKYKSHIVHENMYKQLSNYLESTHKDVVSIEDFHDAFKKENIQERSSKDAMYKLAPEKFELIVSDFITGFVKTLEGLREKGGDRFIGLQQDTNTQLVKGLNHNIHIFQTLEEMLVAIDQQVTRSRTELMGKQYKNKRSYERDLIGQQIRSFISKNNFSTKEYVECIKKLKHIALFEPHIWNAIEEGYKSKGYDKITSPLSLNMTIVKKDGKCSLFDNETMEEIISDAEEYAFYEIGNTKLEDKEVALKKGDKRSIFKDGKKVA